MADIFTPAKKMMANLSYRKKFLLINIITVASTLWLGGFAVLSEYTKVEAAQKRSVGVSLLAINGQLLSELEIHRTNVGLAVQFDNAQARQQALQREVKIDELFDDLAEVYNANKILGLDASVVAALQTRWEQLKRLFA